MLQVWKLGLAKAVGVSNFNTTHLKEIAEAGLPLPSVNQCSFAPVLHGLGHKACTPGGVETCGDLLEYCTANGIVYNGYSPFGGAGSAATILSHPALVQIAAHHNVSTSQVDLNWQWQLGIPTNPEAQNPAYQAENLNFFGFTLNETEMRIMNQTQGTWF